MNADDLDHSPMTKGKYGPAKGNPRTPDWVGQHDPAYLVWSYEKWADKPCSKLLCDECVKDVADNRQSLRVARDQDE